MVGISHHLVKYRVIARIDSGGNGGGIVAVLLGAVLQSTATGSAICHQFLGFSGVDQGVGRRDLGHLGRRLGNLEAGGAADGIIAAFVVPNGHGGLTHIGVVGVLDSVLALGDHRIAILDGDVGPDLFTGIRKAGSAQDNSGVIDLPGFDGDRLFCAQSAVDNVQFRHTGGQRFRGDRHRSGHILRSSGGIGGDDCHAGEVQAFAVNVFGLIRRFSHGNALNRIFRHSQLDAAGGSGVVISIGGGECPGIILLAHGECLVPIQH